MPLLLTSNPNFNLNDSSRIRLRDLEMELLDVEAETHFRDAALDFQYQSRQRVGLALHGLKVILAHVEHLAEVNDAGLGFE